MTARRSRGSAYAICLMVSLLIVGMSAAGLSVSLNKLKAAERSFDDVATLYITEAGLAEAAYLENNDGSKTERVAWYGGAVSAADFDEDNRTIAMQSWRAYQGGEFRITRLRTSATAIQLTAEGRRPGGTAPGKATHRAVARLLRQISWVTGPPAQVFRHSILATRGSLVFGEGGISGGGWASPAYQYQQPILSVNSNPPGASVNPGSGPLPIGRDPSPGDMNSEYLWRGGYKAAGNFADIGTRYAGTVYLAIATHDYDNVPGVENPVFGNVFGAGGGLSRVDVNGNVVPATTFMPGVIQYLDGAQIQGKWMGPVATNDFDGDGVTESWALEFQGKYPDFSLLPVADVIEGATGGAYEGMYLENGTKAKTLEYELLKHIGDGTDETRAAVAAGTFTEDGVNINAVKAAATAANDNALVVAWAAANGRTLNIREYPAGSGKLAIYLGAGIPGFSTGPVSPIDLSTVKGGAPLTLNVYRIQAVEGGTDTFVKVPAGSTIVTQFSDATSAGILIRNRSSLVFQETGATPPGAVNRVYAFDNVKDRNARSIEIDSAASDSAGTHPYSWAESDGSTTAPRRVAGLWADRDTLVVTDGIFYTGSGPTGGWIRVRNGAGTPTNGGDLTVYTGAKDGGSHTVRSDGNLTWFSYNTDYKRPSNSTVDPDFRLNGDGRFFSANDIFIATLGNFHLQGGKIFAGNGGPNSAAATSAEKGGGKIPTNPNARTLIFSGYKGVVSRTNYHELSLSGIANAYLNPKLNPRNTLVAAMGNPNGVPGVLRGGSRQLFMSGKIYAPDYLADGMGGTWIFRGGMVVAGFPDDVEGILDRDGQVIAGEIAGGWTSNFDLALLDEPALVTGDPTPSYGAYRIRGVVPLD